MPQESFWYGFDRTNAPAGPPELHELIPITRNVEIHGVGFASDSSTVIWRMGVRRLNQDNKWIVPTPFDDSGTNLVCRHWQPSISFANYRDEEFNEVRMTPAQHCDIDAIIFGVLNQDVNPHDYEGHVRGKWWG